MKKFVQFIPAPALASLGAYFVQHGSTIINTVIGGVVVFAIQLGIKKYLDKRPAKPHLIKDPMNGIDYELYDEDIKSGLEAWYYPDEREKDPEDPITLNTALELQTQIQGYLEYLLSTIEGADRVVIHKFHNGGKYHTGVSTQKMKLVYEAARNKGFRIDNEMSGPDFNLEKMGGIIKKVVDKRYLHLTIKEDKEQFGFTPYFQLLQEDGVEANHLAILRSGREKYRNIGLLSIHFIKRKKNTLTGKEKMILAKARRDIQMLLVGDTKGYPKNHL